MTIQLTKATYVSGVLAAAGSQHTLDAQTESYLVHIGAATWVDAAYTQGRFEDAKIEYDSDGVATGIVGRANEVVGPVWATDASGNVTGLVGPDGGTIAAGAVFNTKGIGTRIFYSRMGTVSNATAKTYHVTAEVSCHFDAVRPIFASQDVARSYQFAAVKVSAPTSIATDADLLNSGGTWVSVIRHNMTAIPIAVAPGGGNSVRIAYTLPDFVPIKSLDRTDGGTKPLIAMRAYSNDTSATALPCYGNGSSDTLSAWETRVNGMWASRFFNGDGVSTPANFTGGTSATPQIQSPIIGFQFLPRGKVITVASIGDSIMEGRGTYIGEGYVLPALESIQSETGLPIAYLNSAWAGTTMMGGTNGLYGYVARAFDLIRNEHIRPDVLVMSIASPNDEQTTLTDSGVQKMEMGLQAVVRECKRYGVALVLTTWLPTNFAVYPRGNTDAKRYAYNAAALATYENVVDIASLFDGGLDGNSQGIMINSLDGIHPNDTGNALAAVALKAALKSAIFGG